MVEQEPPVTRADGTPARLLVVDDEESLVELLSAALRFAGYDIITARRGSEALAQAADTAPDLIVLDVNLPDIDGFDVCTKLRRDGDTTPVIFLTARDDPEDLRTAFTHGGDDYVTKPFSLDELHLRIRAVLRRTLGAANAAEDDSSVLRCADLSMDERAHVVKRAGAEIELSPTEFRLLRFLLRNQGQVVSKAQILEHVWRYDFGGDASVVETYVSYVRRKLGEPHLLRTVRGFGYMLQEPT